MSIDTLVTRFRNALSIDDITGTKNPDFENIQPMENELRERLHAGKRAENELDSINSAPLRLRRPNK